MADDKDYVIGAIIPPETFMAGRIGEADKAIIGWVVRGVAPAIIRPERMETQG